MITNTKLVRAHSVNLSYLLKEPVYDKVIDESYQVSCCYWLTANLTQDNEACALRTN